MSGDSTLLVGVLGLLLTLLTLVLPMTQWQVSQTVARYIAGGAILTIGYFLVAVAISNRQHFYAPLTYAAEILSWPGTRSVLSQLAVILIVLILVEWAQVRPFYRNLRSLRTAMKRYVLPRHLTEAQISIIADYLSKHEPQRIKLLQPANNEEASSYRSDFQTALTKGGWTVTLDVSDNVREDICTDFREPSQSQLQPPDPKRRKPLELLQQALEAAHVQIVGGSGGSGPDTPYPLTLSIGHRRMDDNDRLARKQQIEIFNKLLQEDEDT